MPTSSDPLTGTPGRDRGTRSRLGRVVPAVVAAVVLVGGAVYATTATDGGRPAGAAPRVGNALVANWQARGEGQRVLGGTRTPGVPSIQRQRHDDVVFTVTVAPARPGPNLVRVDVTKLREGAASHHATAPVRIGTTADDLRGAMPLAEDRPGTDGRWAVVDLPEGTGTVLVTHGRWHRIPFAIDTGTVGEAGGADAVERAGATWAGPDGPECLSGATGVVLAGGTPDTDVCPALSLDQGDRASLVGSVDFLADRGVEEIAVQHDASARSVAALETVTTAAEAAGVSVVAPDATPGPRNALLVVSGWQDAAAALTANTVKPLQQQQIRSDGTWLAPWLLTPGVVDTTAGAMLPLDFDIRAEEAQTYSQTLTSVLQGQAPTASGFEAWRAQRADASGDTGRPALYAASRTAFMPAEPGHEAHGTEVTWFPGGTVTPVAALPAG